MMRRAFRLAAILVVSAATLPFTAHAQRPMNFLDVQEMRSAGSPTPSPDGRWLLHTVTTPDWEEDRSQTDIWLVSVQQGVESARRMTFTTEKNETSPAWAPDGSFFLFSSNRDAPANASGRNQIYLMRPDGGEARRITNAPEGVSGFSFSPDGPWLVYRSGRTGNEQLYRIRAEDLHSETPSAEVISHHPTGISSWEWSPDGRRIYYTSPDTIFEDEQKRRESGFTVDIVNNETPLQSLWVLDLDGYRTTRLTSDPAYTVSGFRISDDGRWVGYTGISADRYKRNITEQGINGDLFLLETATGAIERLTENAEVGESGPYFSPDGRLVAFTAPDDLTRYSMTNRRLYVRPVEQKGGAFRKLGGSFDGHISMGFWSQDGRTVYFNEGVRVTQQLHALDVERDVVRQVTNEAASVSVSRNDDTGMLLISYTDSKTPGSIFTVANINQVGDRSRWRRLTNPNPQVANFVLGEQREVTWTSTDGQAVSGVLTLPVGYREGQRYPLIVSIHGGPAGADLLSFNGGYGVQIYAGAGYAVLNPNYRGSTNYGEAHRTAIVGDYFRLGYDDIMTGVDHLIAEGIVDGDRMGALGWSAGGHWSNWILTHTDRFRAISSGAGTSNWISMYAQSDMQRNRQFYLGDELPYHDFDAYWEQSPIRYITNARTPTMIHVVEGDPRVPSPQSVELHMALKQLGVETELFMYPGAAHSIPDARNRLVKSVSELRWMDYHVRGIGEKFSWREALGTLGKEGAQQ